MKEAACFQGKHASRWLERWPPPFRLLRHKKASSLGSIVATVKSDSMPGELVTNSATSGGLDKLLGPETPVKP